MRKPSDICLLCKTNPATKTNSHILPRFISTDFLGEKGKPRKGYSLSSETIPGKKPRPLQDSPKEDFILCEECEHYFSILEGQSADLFNNWPEKVKSGEFTLTKLHEHVSVVDCKTGNPAITRLLIYSLFWRVSISSHDLFSEFMLDPAVEESLREALISVKSLHLAQLLVAIEKTRIKVFPFTIVTAKTFQDATANILMANKTANPAALHADRFGFLLFNDLASVRENIVFESSNATQVDCKMTIFSEQLWNEQMVKRPIDRLVEEIKIK